MCGAALRAGSLLAGNGELLTPIIRWDKHMTSQGRGTWREVGAAAGAPSQDGPPMRCTLLCSCSRAQVQRPRPPVLRARPLRSSSSAVEDSCVL